MKIKVNEKIKNIINILRGKEEKETEVINFENRTRKGAQECVLEDEEDKKEYENNKNKMKKIFIGMSMLLVLTIMVNFRMKDYIKIAQIIPPEEETITVSSSIDNQEAHILKAKEELIFIPALEGEVQKIYSQDKVIYSKTLNQWKTHEGIDIAPTKNSNVMAIEKGVVDSIYMDDFYGMTVKIEHIDGYMSSYSNLDENVCVNVGESVIKGQKIGKVGNTAVGEALDNPHLHFVLYLNNKIVNPTYIFK